MMKKTTIQILPEIPGKSFDVNKSQINTTTSPCRLGLIHKGEFLFYEFESKILF